MEPRFQRGDYVALVIEPIPADRPPVIELCVVTAMRGRYAEVAHTRFVQKEGLTWHGAALYYKSTSTSHIPVDQLVFLHRPEVNESPEVNAPDSESKSEPDGPVEVSCDLIVRPALHHVCQGLLSSLTTGRIDLAFKAQRGQKSVPIDYVDEIYRQMFEVISEGLQNDGYA